MSIMGFIAKKRAEYQQDSVERQKNKILAQSAQLKAQKVREGELAKVNADYQKQKRDVDAIRGYNTKIAETRPNRLRAIGQGLSKAMAATKEHVAKVNHGGVSPKNAKRMARFGDYNRGSTIDFGLGRKEEARSSPFDFTAGKKKVSRKGPWEL